MGLGSGLGFLEVWGLGFRVRFRVRVLTVRSCRPKKREQACGRARKIAGGGKGGGMGEGGGKEERRGGGRGGGEGNMQRQRRTHEKPICSVLRGPNFGRSTGLVSGFSCRGVSGLGAKGVQGSASHCCLGMGTGVPALEGLFRTIINRHAKVLLNLLLANTPDLNN